MHSTPHAHHPQLRNSCHPIVTKMVLPLKGLNGIDHKSDEFILETKKTLHQFLIDAHDDGSFKHELSVDQIEVFTRIASEFGLIVTVLSPETLYITHRKVVTNIILKEETIRLMNQMKDVFTPDQLDQMNRNNDSYKNVPKTGKNTLGFKQIPRSPDFTPNDPDRRKFLTPYELRDALTDLKSQYEQTMVTKMQLPARKAQQVIMDLIQKHQVIIVEGATGSGKTTQVPQMIAEAMRSQQLPVKMFVAEPRKIAAITVAERVATEMGCFPGEDVGFQIRLKRMWGRRTFITYCTNGIILNVLMDRKGHVLKDMTHIIIDEVHERDRLGDMLVTTIKEYLPDHPHLKVIIMSATLECDKIVSYFSGFSVGTITIPGIVHTIDQFPLEKILPMVNWKQTFFPPKSNDSLDLVQAMASLTTQSKEDDLSDAYDYDLTQRLKDLAARERIDTNIDHDLLIKLLNHILENPDKKFPTTGAILIFLPGYEDIKRAIHRIKKDLKKYNLIVLMLHSMLSPQRQKKAFAKYPRRKIVVSTNIAETSVTIEDANIVIDSGRVKENRFDDRMTISSLEDTMISQANTKQRMGRVGRTEHGFCFRLYSTKNFNRMRQFPIPEMVRLPTDGLCLQIKQLSADDDVHKFVEKLLDPPSNLAICESIRSLKDMDALTPEGHLTSLGYHLLSLSVDPQLGKALIFSVIFKCVDPILSIVASVSYKSPFHGRRDPDLAPDSMSDQIPFAIVFQKWSSFQSKEERQRYARQNQLNEFTLKYISIMRKKLRNSLNSLVDMNIHYGHNWTTVNEHSNDMAIVRSCLFAGFYPNMLQVQPGIGHEQDKLNSKFPFHFKYNKSSCLSKKITKEKERFDFIEEMMEVLDMVNLNVSSDQVKWIIYECLIKHRSGYLAINCTKGSSFLVMMLGNLLNPKAMINPLDDSASDSSEDIKVGDDEEQNSDSSGFSLIGDSEVSLNQWISLKVKPHDLEMIQLTRFILRLICEEILMKRGAHFVGNSEQRNMSRRGSHVPPVDLISTGDQVTKVLDLMVRMIRLEDEGNGSFSLPYLPISYELDDDEKEEEEEDEDENEDAFP